MDANAIHLVEALEKRRDLLGSTLGITAADMKKKVNLWTEVIKELRTLGITKYGTDVPTITKSVSNLKYRTKKKAGLITNSENSRGRVLYPLNSVEEKVLYLMGYTCVNEVWRESEKGSALPCREEPSTTQTIQDEVQPTPKEEPSTTQTIQNEVQPPPKEDPPTTRTTQDEVQPPPKLQEVLLESKQASSNTVHLTPSIRVIKLLVENKQAGDIVRLTPSSSLPTSLQTPTVENEVQSSSPSIPPPSEHLQPSTSNSEEVQKSKSFKDPNNFNMDVYFDITEEQLPIIYSSNYNIHFMGLEKIHPFDSAKWEKIYNILLRNNIISKTSSVEPREAKEEVLRIVHPESYLKHLKWSLNVARITEVPCVSALPNSVVQRKVLRPFRYHTGGTILAGKLAMERGWALNIGGGFHHCSAEQGGGFCAYADITLCIKFLFMNYSHICKVMIVDLDAHQGNGHERDFMGDDRVYILDVYNQGIYPHDEHAKGAIRKKVELKHRTEDAEYLEKVSRNLLESLDEFAPQFILYNAGTDILKGDPLGCLSITPEGIIERDEIVFKAAAERKVPIVFVTSGGYQKCTARIIAESIINLQRKGLLP